MTPDPEPQPPTIVNLTIPLASLDTNELLSEWRWCVPAEYTPIQMTKFGDWFFVDPQRQVHMLDLIEGTLLEIAPSVSAFNELKNTDEKKSGWFLDGLVFRCIREGLLLNSSQCYGWRIHPMMGGKFKFENIRVIPLRVHQSLMGQFFRQCRNPKSADLISSPKINPS